MIMKSIIKSSLSDLLSQSTRIIQPVEGSPPDPSRLLRHEDLPLLAEEEPAPLLARSLHLFIRMESLLTFKNPAGLCSRRDLFPIR